MDMIFKQSKFIWSLDSSTADMTLSQIHLSTRLLTTLFDPVKDLRTKLSNFSSDVYIHTNVRCAIL